MWLLEYQTTCIVCLDQNHWLISTKDSKAVSWGHEAISIERTLEILNKKKNGMTVLQNWPQPSLFMLQHQSWFWVLYSRLSSIIDRVSDSFESCLIVMIFTLHPVSLTIQMSLVDLQAHVLPNKAYLSLRL